MKIVQSTQEKPIRVSPYFPPTPYDEFEFGDTESVIHLRDWIRCHIDVTNNRYNRDASKHRIPQMDPLPQNPFTRELAKWITRSM